MYYSMRDWTLKGFEKAKAQNKKYIAIIVNKDGETKKINFGDNRYEQYKDNTGLGIYSNLDHNDISRRRLYRLRHHKDIEEECFSSGYFALKYLW